MWSCGRRIHGGLHARRILPAHGTPAGGRGRGNTAASGSGCLTRLVIGPLTFDQFVALFSGTCGPEPHQVRKQAAAVNHRGVEAGAQKQAQVRGGNTECRASFQLNGSLEIAPRTVGRLPPCLLAKPLQRMKRSSAVLQRRAGIRQKRGCAALHKIGRIQSRRAHPGRVEERPRQWRENGGPAQQPEQAVDDAFSVAENRRSSVCQCWRSAHSTG